MMAAHQSDDVRAKHHLEQEALVGARVGGPGAHARRQAHVERAAARRQPRVLLLRLEVQK